jgi:hypothetical protein
MFLMRKSIAGRRQISSYGSWIPGFAVDLIVRGISVIHDEICSAGALPRGERTVTDAGWDMFYAYTRSSGFGLFCLGMIFFADLSLFYADTTPRLRHASRTLVASREGTSLG